MSSGMSGIAISTALGFAAVAATTALFLLRREKSLLHWHLIALMASVTCWTGGGVLFLRANTLPSQHLALDLAFLGALTTPTLYLLLAARFARVGVLEERPVTSALLLLPCTVFYVAYLTNDSHGLFLRGPVPIGSLGGGPIEWAGPLFWISAAWGLTCGIAAVALQSHSALRLVASHERARGLLLAIAAVPPLVTSVLHLFSVVRFSYDPVPSSFAFSAILIAVAVVRFRVLDALPLARRDVIEHMRDGVLLADADGLVLDANAAAARLLGASIGILRARPMAHVLEPLESAAQRGAIAAALGRLYQDRLPQTLDLRTSDDRRIELRASLVLGRLGDPAGAFVELRDRTDEHRYERAIRQSQKLETVGTLVAGVAHEVNNPLAFVRANLTQLRRASDAVLKRLDAFDDEQADELRDLPALVDESLEGVERIARVVDGMRRFSRVPTEDASPVDLNQVASDAVRLAGFHGNRTVAVLPRLAADLPSVRGSAERLVQVLLNLLVNAKQALRDRRDGRVVVETAFLGDHVELRVCDNGPGVPLSIQHRIFDPFFTTKDPDEGTGLGLSIAFDIVREHRGTIEVVSEEGGGACFVVRLPAGG
jgi:two-component system sensor histidine kinase HupT/HoxJ